jgi:hypothetical protein
MGVGRPSPPHNAWPNALVVPFGRILSASALPDLGALDMDILVTSSRLPFALEEIRKLGRSGHNVHAADTFFTSPGSHSRYVKSSHVTAPPAYDAPAFLDDLEAILRKRSIDRLVPSFEEVFYIAMSRWRFDRLTHVFAPSFETLRRLHDKVRFLQLARSLGLRVPETIVCESADELARAVKEFPRFFARPAYTRGGVSLFTNTGPLAGATRLEECEPSPTNPYLVQPFVEGRDLCTFGIAHGGRLAGHATYVHPLTLEHAGGIVFESIESPESLEIARTIVEATGYEGQISLDLLATDKGVVMVECNPRPTAGLTVMPDEMLDDAFVDRHPDRVLVAPPGMRRKLSLALLRNAFVRPSLARENLAALVSNVKDLYFDPNDLSPLFYQLLAYGRVWSYRWRRGRMTRSDLMNGYFHDLCWNGDAIDQKTLESSREVVPPSILRSAER